MATQFSVRTSDSMPERIDVTERIERLKQQQAGADQKAKVQETKPLARAAAASR
jgi:hypothetical protein